MGLGVLCAFLTGLFGYVDQHFHDPERFVADTADLADNAEVRERMFEGFRTEIIALADGTSTTAVDDTQDLGTDGAGADDTTDDGEAGDEGAVSNFDTPVTDARIERDQVIESVLLDAFESDLWQQMFSDGLVSVQQQVVRSASLEDAELLRDPGLVTFNARPLYQQIYPALAADDRTAEITQNEVPAHFGVYSIADRETTVDAVWWLIDNGPKWRGLVTFLAVGCLIAAAIVAERRPSRVIEYGGGIAGLAIVAIVAIYIVRAIVPVLSSGAGSAGAVTAVYSANLDPFVSTLIRMLIIGVVVAALGGVAKLIWPDDWIYGSVDDGRGVRSIRRRRGSAEPAGEPQPQPQAAAVPVAYPPYGQPYAQPPYGYQPAQGWGQPWPGQPYAPNPWQQPPPQGHPGAIPIQVNDGMPTVPVTAVEATASTGQTSVTPTPREDHVQAVPRVSPDQPPPDESVADDVGAFASAATGARGPSPEPDADPDTGRAPASPEGATSSDATTSPGAEPAEPDADTDDDDDPWATDGQW